MTTIQVWQDADNGHWWWCAVDAQGCATEASEGPFANRGVAMAQAGLSRPLCEVVVATVQKTQPCVYCKAASINAVCPTCDELREMDLAARTRGQQVAEALASLASESTYGLNPAQRQWIQTLVHGTHRTEQQNVMRLFKSLCAVWAEQDSDLRNQATVKLAKQITAIKKGLPYV